MLAEGLRYTMTDTRHQREVLGVTSMLLGTLYGFTFGIGISLTLFALGLIFGIPEFSLGVIVAFGLFSVVEILYFYFRVEKILEVVGRGLGN